MDPPKKTKWSFHETFIKEHEQREYFLGLFILIASLGSVLIPLIVYAIRPSRGIELTTTRPFVDFHLLGDVLGQVVTLKDALAVNKTLLQTAWCDEPTGNYYAHWETRAPVCSCIQGQFLDFIGLVLNSTLNTTGSVSTTVGNVTTTTPSDALRIENYLVTPWLNDTLAQAALSKYVNSTIAVPTAYVQSYAGSIASTCMPYHPVWKIEPYYGHFNPVVASFYCCTAMFIWAFSFIFRVDAVSKYDMLARLTTVTLAVAVAIVWILGDRSSNWFYSVGIIYFSVNYATSLNVEMQSVKGARTEKVLDPSKLFFPPSPLVVGMWQYIQILFPVIVVYLGATNYVRDVYALLGFYVIGYGVVSAVQRFFWSKWYMRENNRVEAYSKKNPYPPVLTKQSSLFYRMPVMWSLAFTYIFLFFIGSVIVFAGWYNQTLVSGNWFALIISLVFAGVFLIELLETRVATLEDPLYISMVQILQLLAVVGCTVAFAFATMIDDALA